MLTWRDNLAQLCLLEQAVTHPCAPGASRSVLTYFPGRCWSSRCLIVRDKGGASERGASVNSRRAGNRSPHLLWVAVPWRCHFTNLASTNLWQTACSCWVSGQNLLSIQAMGQVRHLLAVAGRGACAVRHEAACCMARCNRPVVIALAVCGRRCCYPTRSMYLGHPRGGCSARHSARNHPRKPGHDGEQLQVCVPVRGEAHAQAAWCSVPFLCPHR